MPFQPPTIEEAIQHGADIGLPTNECERFWYFYDSKSWKVGKVSMAKWKSALAGWKLRWQEERERKGMVTLAPIDKLLLRDDKLKYETEQRRIRESYADHMDKTAKDIARLKWLRERLTEIETKLRA